MNMLLLFFYGTIITLILATGFFIYAKALYKESKQLPLNHTNFGSD